MTNANYDLTGLSVAQSKDSWHFGITTTATITGVAFGLYLDLDHVEGSGATSDPAGYQVSTIAAHRPEYAIYLYRTAGAFSADQVVIYRWTGSAWAFPQSLDDVGGVLTSTASYVEIAIPNTAIGMEQHTGSAALSLFTVPAAGGHAQDTVPSDPNVNYAVLDTGPGTTQLSRFTSVSERMNPAWPPTNATGDPTIFPSLPPFLWRWPKGAPWYGYHFQLSIDPLFTSVIVDVTAHVGGLNHVPSGYTHHNDAWGDNTYYWRARPIYDAGNAYRGAWSQPQRFERQGLVAQNLHTSVSFATPTFTWDMVEGAHFYEVQVDNDPGFASREAEAQTSRNAYTPQTALARGTYYWRVRVNRMDGVANDWTQPISFTLSLPTPTGLQHFPAGVVGRAPTLCWNPISATGSDGFPVLSAWRYSVQVSRGDPNFSALYDNADVEQSCWTPTKGYHDGTYYWRVAMVDGMGQLGEYSAPAQFTKQYPIATLLSPISAGTPTFTWTPVTGAARYQLEVSQSPTFASLYDQVTTDNTSYTPVKKYADQQTYYWRVAMVDYEGKPGEFNDQIVLIGDYPYRIYLPALQR
jgi:hypothetical protein